MLAVSEHPSAPGDIEQPQPGAERGASQGLLAFSLYLGLSCVIWLPPIGGAIASRYVGYAWTDARLYQWGLS